MELIDKVFEFISPDYILSVNIASYVIILIINSFRKVGVRTVVKRLTTVLSGIVLALVYYHFEIITIAVIIPSFFTSVITYDYVIKGIISKFDSLKHKS